MADRQCKSDYIRIRCTPQFKGVVKADAKERGLTVSDHIVTLLAEYHAKIECDRLTQIFKEE